MCATLFVSKSYKLTMYVLFVRLKWKRMVRQVLSAPLLGSRIRLLNYLEYSCAEPLLGETS